MKPGTVKIWYAGPNTLLRYWCDQSVTGFSWLGFMGSHTPWRPLQRVLHRHASGARGGVRREAW